MKRERRHELQHNELAQWIIKTYGYIQPYANAILGVIVLVLLAVAAWTWWSRQSAAQQAAAWNELYIAQANGNPGEIMEVVENNPDRRVGHWAAVVAGDMYLASGCQQLFTSKATAAQDLRKAVESYLMVLEQSQTPMLRERATFGLGRAYEALSATRQGQGELDDAIEQYQTLVDEWPDGAYTQIARQRLQDLQRSATKQFYDKFAQYDPKPAFTEQQPGTPGEKLPFNTDALPDFSELPAPETPESQSAPLESPSPEKPEASTSGSDDASPEETQKTSPRKTEGPSPDESQSQTPQPDKPDNPADSAASGPPTETPPAEQ